MSPQRSSEFLLFPAQDLWKFKRPGANLAPSSLNGAHRKS